MAGRLDWLLLIALLGAVQGVFLTGALFTKRRNRTANRLLAAMMLAFSIYLATSVYHVLGLERRFPHFFGAAYPMPFLFGPLVYLYAVFAADRSRQFTRRELLHFVPFLAAIIIGLPVYLMSGAEKLAFYEALRRGEEPLWMAVVDMCKFVSGSVYAVATIAFLRRHRERVKDSYSSIERVNLRWLFWLGVSAAGVWALALSFLVLEAAAGIRVEGTEDYVSIAIAVLVYAIGYRGLRQPEIFRYETAEFPVMTLAAPPVEPPPSAERGPEPEPEAASVEARYERSGLTERQAQRLRDDLVRLMETERPWQDSELTLADLAARLSTTPHKLSEVLNVQVRQTFYDFVNGYRVREVQRRIAAGEARKVKMLTLAMNAGFASKSTFNLVFKKHTNQTPSDYQQAAGA